MKQKIAITIEEDILNKIESSNKFKNRSSAIEYYIRNGIENDGVESKVFKSKPYNCEYNSNGMKKIKKCIIPAAGFGTRFLPATKAQPKEMLPIVDKPVIQYLVEEAVKSGIEDIVIVTGRGKRSIEDHFDVSFELEHTLVEKGKIKELKEVENISTMANISYVRQPIPRGDGDALLRVKELIGDEPFLVLFGDDIVYGDRPASYQLIETFYRKNSPIIALENVSKNRTSSYGIIEPKHSDNGVHLVGKFLEKPKPEETESTLGVIGKYILTPEIFNFLEKVNPGNDGEIRLADAFSLMLEQRDIYGLEVKGKRYDTGDKFGFLKASIDLALEREDLGYKLKEFLKKKVSEFK